MTETMTVHQALCEVKLADKKINQMFSNANDFTVIGVNTNPDSAKANVKGIDLDTFINNAKSSYQKIKDIFNRVDAIKAAISKSNAATMINVGGKTMSVAEAIYQMKYGIKNKKNLIANLQKQSSYVQISFRTAEMAVEEKLEKSVIALFGKDNIKANTDEVLDYKDKYKKKYMPVIVDPINIQDAINKLSEEIDQFEMNVDSAIQVSNATTMITIEY
jgi:hypothetical protein